MIVGGGPAGSTCAWKLRHAGLDVVVIDKAHFPRDKTCAGWITPQVVEALRLDVPEYSGSRVFQPISGFYVAVLGQSGTQVEFEHPVSFGIRRCEFDDYLLRRSGARLRLGEPITRIERIGEVWRLNGTIEARMLVGAGGHFCPIARQMRAPKLRTQLVTAVEAEFPITTNLNSVASNASTPRLYFRDDLSGYGWCVRKSNYLNIGIGLVDSRETSSALSRLLKDLNQDGTLSHEIPVNFKGHAYYLYDGCESQIVDDGVLLVGDAAGLAYRESGEGIRPAIESAIFAARVVVEANGQYDKGRLGQYRAMLTTRLGTPRSPLLSGWFAPLGHQLRRTAFRHMIRSPRLVREVLLRNRFLHSYQPGLIT
ncbi:MAG: NAD(P)/FAD-dependent oxidoreductase [Planctomycetaceae bacterium]